MDIWYESSYNTAAALICLSALFYTFLQGRTRKPQNRYFALIVGDIALNAICATAGLYAEAASSYSEAARIVLYVTQYLYFLTHTALGFIFFIYTLHLCDVAVDTPPKNLIILCIPAIITELLVLLNPVLHLVYYYDSDYSFHRGPMEWLLYVMAVFYAAHCAGILIRYRHTLFRDRWAAVICFYVLTMTGMLVQMVARHVRLELFCESLAVLGLMFTMEDDDHLRERVTSVYNRNALVMDLFRYFARGRKFCAICLRLRDAASLQRLLGTDAVETVPVMVAAFLKQIHPVYYIYRSSSSSFVLIIPEGDRRCRNDLEEVILDRFSRSFMVGKSEVDLTYCLLEASGPGELTNAADVLLMADIQLPASVSSHVLKGDDMHFLFRAAQVEGALHRALSGDGFKLEYVPIYSTKDHTLWSEEARLYIDDEELGRVSQDEFMSVAQDLSTTADIGAILLEKSLKRFGVEKTAAGRMSVDLYSALWQRERFVETLSRGIKEYSIDASRVSLEISEPALRGDLSLLRHMTSILKEMGFSLTLDGYGAGYADMRTVFSLDFDHVKLDRSLMEKAPESSVGAAVLEENVDMIRRMGLAVIADGTDSAGQLGIAERLGIDYFSGKGGRV